jgi:GTP-binding protein HflX
VASTPRKATARAIVVHPALKGAASARLPEARLEEARGLALAIDLDIRASLIAALTRITPATYLGHGKVEELARLVEKTGAGLIVVDTALSPGQQRNLERATKAKVLDRTGLILEIFGRRARTREGRLQVELAHLGWQKSRLVRSWTHLERQRGGFGFLGGPGETQIEADRRLIEERMARIEDDLKHVRRTRALHRKGRERVPYPVVALVGYTNAGKSSLFNALTKAAVVAKDLLFATLDPTMRQLVLPRGRKVILSDTVGFIADLPTTLIAAFRATLEEVVKADVIVQVRDVSHPDSEAQAGDVAAVLGEIGIDAERRSRIVEVWNKIDLLAPGGREAMINSAARRPRTVAASALTGEGLERLLELVEAEVATGASEFEVRLGAAAGDDLAWLYRRAEVLERVSAADGSLRLRVRMPAERVPLAEARLGQRFRPTAAGKPLADQAAE